MGAFAKFMNSAFSSSLKHSGIDFDLLQDKALFSPKGTIFLSKW